MTVMGTVLVQPQRMRRARVTDPAITLATEIANLGARLALDTEQGGQLALVAKQALDEAIEQLLEQRLAVIKNLAPRIADWLLRVLRATLGLGPELRVSSALDVLKVLRGFIDAIANASKNGNAARIRPYVAELLGIVQDDIGLSLPALETAFWGVVDTIIVRLEALPPEPQRAARENRLDTIRILRRVRQLIRGKFPLPTLDADRIASALAEALRRFNVAALTRAAQCVSDAINKMTEAAQAVTELVPFGPLTGFRSIGAAAAVGSGETYCWYASWLYEEQVIINASKTQIRRGDTILIEGSNLTIASIPEFSTAESRYTFNHIELDSMESLTFAMYVIEDAAVLVCHLISLESGDYASNVFNAAGATIFGTAKAIGRSPAIPIGAEDWAVPIIASFLGSFEGIHTTATFKNKFMMWVTLVLPDVIEAVIYRQGGVIGRDLVLSFCTVLNHGGAGVSKPLNSKHLDGVAFIGEWLGGFVFMKFYPREEYAQPFVSGKHALKFFLFWDLFLNNLFYVMGRLVGCILPAALSEFNAEAFAKPLPLNLLLVNPLKFFVQLYLDKEGDTNDGKYNPTNTIEYIGYPPKETSPYVLPFLKDRTYYCVQGNQGFFSHHHPNGEQQYSYDFSLDQDEPILAARPGTVIDYFDWVADDTNPDDAEYRAAKAEAALANLPATQTQEDSWNFIMIRHDCDDTGTAQPPNNDHDKAEGGRVVTTYAIYGHGRKGSVRAAFPALAANAIIGQKVKTGQRIMLSGDTGVSFNNHLHIMVLEGPAAAGGGAPVAPISRFNLPAPRATLPFVFKDIGVCKKLDWYTGTQDEVT